MSMLEAALAYARLGWSVFPLSASKKPLKGSHGFKDASTSEATIRQWFPPGGRGRHNLGLATGGDGPVVLDGDGAGGIAEFEALCAQHGQPKLARGGTLTAATARGRHWYLILPPGKRLRSRNARRTAKGGDGLDIKADKGYVVIPPSVNWGAAGGPFTYRWMNSAQPVVMPDWLIAWCEAQSSRPPGNHPAESIRGGMIPALGQPPAWLAGRAADLTQRHLACRRAAELPDILEALRAIPGDCGYDRWFEIGAALWDWDSGDYGLAVFKAWSASSERHGQEQDERACEDKWREYAAYRAGGGVPITVATLYAVADQHREGGGGLSTGPASQVTPPVSPPHGEQRQFSGASWAPQGVGDLGRQSGDQGGSTTQVNGHGAEEFVASFNKAKDPLIELNDKHAVIGDIGGKCLVMSYVQSKADPRLQIPSFQTFKSFSERYANRYVPVKKEKPNGEIEEKAEQLGAHWLKWGKRRSYEGMDLVPGGEAVLPNGYLNLWAGFAVEPQPALRDGQIAPYAGWPRMQRHIHETLAGGDTASADYIMKFAAWAVQNPGERAEVALVFRGGKGTGKGTFANALADIFGSHGLQIYNSKHLTGAFNAHQRNCLLLFADEAFWAGDKQGESTLKGLLTERTLLIEQKGVDAVPWKNRLKVIMAANADWAIPASHDERRFAVFDVDDKFARDPLYFDPLHREMKEGGLQAMLYDLLHYDIGAWHPRQIVQTEALQRQKERSMPPLDDWFTDLLDTGELPGYNKEYSSTQGGELFRWVQNYLPQTKWISPRAFGLFLRQQGCIKKHVVGGSRWIFPELNTLRKKWEKKYYSWEWSNKNEEWCQKNPDNTKLPQ